MKIALLHLSDIHLNNRKCINNENIKRIAVTLYSERKVDRVLILISGDIAFSGSSYEYTAAKYLIGTLISEIKKIFQWKSKNKIVVICVPGNHDMTTQKIVHQIITSKIYTTITAIPIILIMSTQNFMNIII